MEAADSSFFYRLSITYRTRYNLSIADATIHSQAVKSMKPTGSPDWWRIPVNAAMEPVPSVGCARKQR